VATFTLKKPMESEAGFRFDFFVFVYQRAMSW
jgi:hypothetical protein